jgi:hypothetical protein
MTNVTAPPLEDLIADKTLRANASYAAFFENLYLGDVGTAWTPVATNLTIVGTPTYTGQYYRLSDRWYAVTITVSSTTTTAATGGSTYFSGFPIQLLNDGALFSLVGTGLGGGVAQQSTQRFYPSSWGASGLVTLVALVEAK